MKQRLSSKVDMTAASCRSDAINDLLDFHTENNDFFVGLRDFLEEIDVEINKRMQPGYHSMKLCNANVAINMISTLHKRPVG